MRRTAIAALCCACAIAAPAWSARAFPIAVSVIGGIGAGYYSMDELNEHIGLFAQENFVTIDGLGRGVNFRVEGRLWYRGIVALAGGYQHFWGETSAVESSSDFSYRTPADVYSIGVVFAFLRLENAFDFCIGLNRCWADAVYGTNETSSRRLTEFKGEDAGYEAYAEIHTNFINPIEVGMQLGYRGLSIGTLNDKFGDPGYFEPGSKIEIDYSGVFFYLTTGIRIP